MLTLDKLHRSYSSVKDEEIVSISFGCFPDREYFEECFEEEFPDDHVFKFHNDRRVGTCSLYHHELWDELVKAENDGDKEWCSRVLGVIGILWE